MQTSNRTRRKALPSEFYCRRGNTLVGGCPLAGGPCQCPLRPECPARDRSMKSEAGGGA